MRVLLTPTNVEQTRLRWRTSGRQHARSACKSSCTMQHQPEIDAAFALLIANGLTPYSWPAALSSQPGVHGSVAARHAISRSLRGPQYPEMAV